ncbi:MAG: NAD(P)-dependent oxidoreductase [Victivallaceae bacterium]
MNYPETIKNEAQLEELLSIPGDGLIDMTRRLDGDIMILGIGGKMGLTLGRQAVNAIKAAGVDKKVIGVSRFGDETGRRRLEAWGVETLACDLLNPKEVAGLPDVKNIIFMAGRKFGTGGTEELTWAMNALVPGYVGTRFKNSNIVVFSTGCVYPLVSSEEGGCTEDTAPAPVGEYAQSCLGRERIFSYCSKQFGAKILLFRLNYAIDLRYGVLHDIGRQVFNEEPVNRTVEYFNVLWQGDANCQALRCLEHCASPANIMNVTGPETINVEYIAEEFAKLLGKKISYAGKPADKCYLSDAGKAVKLFGKPRVSVEQMVKWQAAWFMQGGSSLGKPTHFEVNDGKF